MSRTFEVRDGMSLTYLTTDQIEALRQEAGLAGDSAQVEICERALNCSRPALRECARVIGAARAQRQVAS